MPLNLLSMLMIRIAMVHGMGHLAIPFGTSKKVSMLLERMELFMSRKVSILKIVTIAKSILLIGENKSKTIIDGDTNGIVVYICADDVDMSGFTIRSSRIGIIVVNSSQSKITGNTIRNNSVYGCLLYTSPSPRDCS